MYVLCTCVCVLVYACMRECVCGGWQSSIIIYVKGGLL